MKWITPLLPFVLSSALAGAGEPVVSPYDGETSTTLSGLVTDAFPDDVDPNFIYLILADETRSLPISVMLNGEDRQRFLALIGRRIEVVGYLHTTSSGISRAYLGDIICTDGHDCIHALGDDPDPFDAPLLDLPITVTPNDLLRLGRRRIKGHVRAVWDGSEALIQPPVGRPIRLSLPVGTAAPVPGEAIEVVGSVETDTFSIWLTHAVWRSTDAVSTPPQDIHTVSGNELVFDQNGSPSYQSQFNGQTVRLAGIVRGLSDIDRGRFALDVDHHLFMIDASAFPHAVDGLEPGCTVEVTGTCILDTDKWQPHAIFPRVRGLRFIPAAPGDIRILARSPWLTPSRTGFILLSFTAFILVFFIWNRILWLRAFRRGQALSSETIARAEADMRTRERTRLAVELHDSLVQNLSGIIMELETLRRSNATRAEGERFARAERMLRSCHTDLRNCLWDLRSEALEEQNLQTAIARTLLPHVKDIDLDLRLNVQRKCLTDNTTHIILRAIRELVLNAIRHGSADHIWIAGTIDQDVLYVSVRDNGCGFDPPTAPGVLQGHFGLEGIRERLRNLGGTLAFEREPARGMRAILTIPVPQGAHSA